MYYNCCCYTHSTIYSFISYNVVVVRLSGELDAIYLWCWKCCDHVAEVPYSVHCTHTQARDANKIHTVSLCNHLIAFEFDWPWPGPECVCTMRILHFYFNHLYEIHLFSLIARHSSGDFFSFLTFAFLCAPIFGIETVINFECGLCARRYNAQNFVWRSSLETPSAVSVRLDEMKIL